MMYIKYWLSLCRGRLRIFYGFCPFCNSDAPEVYDCPCCNGYKSASGDKYPPTKKTKAQWWIHWSETARARLAINKAVKKSRTKKGVWK